METGTRSGVFRELADFPVSGGKGKGTLVGDGVFPEAFGDIRGLADLGGRRIEIRNAAGDIVMTGFPPVVSLPKSTKRTLAFEPVAGGSGGTATLKLSHKSKSGAMKFDLKVKGMPKRLKYMLRLTRKILSSIHLFVPWKRMPSLLEKRQPLFCPTTRNFLST